MVVTARYYPNHRGFRRLTTSAPVGAAVVAVTMPFIGVAQAAAPVNKRGDTKLDSYREHFKVAPCKVIVRSKFGPPEWRHGARFYNDSPYAIPLEVGQRTATGVKGARHPMRKMVGVMAQSLGTRPWYRRHTKE